ncbi:MAG: DUF4402 domain-containing protein [Bacteroidales bacterium]|nr:DUF4402 domain-containing protein [Bacteroidales bacterium]
MKSTFKILAMVAVLMAAATTVSAQSATADATANILSALGCSNTVGDAGDLDWGDIVPGGSQSVVNITSDATGTRSLSSGDATLVATDDGNSAEFTLTGLADAVVDLSLTSASITLSDGAAATMDATLSLSSTTATLTGGTAIIYVGGDLTVAASQTTGSYTTTFEVNAQYQ